MPQLHDLTFSIATLADAPAIGALVRAAYAKWVPIIGREPRPMLADYARNVIEHRIDLLREGDSLVGLIETKKNDDHLWIENVAVAPSQQGRGFGRRLMAHAEKLARDARRSELRLVTNAAFASNAALYQKLGYVVTRTEPFMGGVALYMSKSLA